MAQTIFLNMIPNTPSPRIYWKQGDIGETMDFILLYGSSEYTIPSGATVKLQGTKPSGLGFVINCTTSGNTASATLTETVTNEAGHILAEVVVTKSGLVLASKTLVIDLERSAHPEGTTDGDLDHILPKYVSVAVTTLPAGSSATYSYDPQTNTATFGIPKGADGSLTSDVLAQTYSTSKTYAVGDYVYYSGDLYRCTTAITTAEAWTSGHWTKVALADDVTDLKSEINDNLDDVIVLGSQFEGEELTTTSMMADYAIKKGGGGFVSNASYSIYMCDVTDYIGMQIFIDSPSVPSNMERAIFSDNRGISSGTKSTAKVFDVVPQKTTGYNNVYVNVSVKDGDVPHIYLFKNNSLLREIPYDSLNVITNSYINGTNGNVVSGAGASGYKRIVMPAEFKQIVINPNFYHASGLGWRFVNKDGEVASYGTFNQALGTKYTINNPDFDATTFEFTQATTSNVPVIEIYKNAEDINVALSRKMNVPNAQNPLAKVGNSPSFISIYKKIVHIGDSLTRGQTDTTSPTTSGADIPDYSRPTIMGKMIGNENLNLGLGGRTASDEYTSGGQVMGWYTNATGGTQYTTLFPPEAFLENPGDCYIIALGTNDVSAGGFTGNVATDIDDDNLNNNANTSVGGYAKIIQKIQEIQPKAKIFCVTIPHTRNNNTPALRADANSKIADIVNHFDNCYLVDLFTYAEQDASGDFAQYYINSSHYNALGYMKRSLQYISYIDWIMENNLSDFRNVNFIGTNYDYVP